MARYIKKQRRAYYTNIRIPEVLRARYGGKRHLIRTLRTRDETVAHAKALKIKAQLMLEAEALNGSPAASAALGGSPGASAALLRDIYTETKEMVRSDDFALEGAPYDEDPKDAAASIERDQIESEFYRRGFAPNDDIPADLQARVDALTDALQEYRGKRVKPRTRYEPSFEVVAQQWLDQWKAGRKKETNTADQYWAILRMFSSYWGERTVREIRSRDAAEFVDQLRTLSGTYKSNPKVKEMSWGELIAKYGGKGTPLSPATINRHVNRLVTVWQYAKKREMASGDNPFDDLKVPNKGQDKGGYVAWSDDQLKALLKPPPKRSDLYELILVGMYTALRINEAASLTWGQIKKEGKVWYFDILEAKTKAGRRQVPVHSKLKWLLKEERRGKDDERVWPKFNPEGPGKKPGADASRLFGDHKRGRGFEGRRWLTGPLMRAPGP